ncbi:hypothetical protein ACOSQ2_033048 [Xanthoceras sorbifolium]
MYVYHVSAARIRRSSLLGCYSMVADHQLKFPNTSPPLPLTLPCHRPPVIPAGLSLYHLPVFVASRRTSPSLLQLISSRRRFICHLAISRRRFTSPSLLHLAISVAADFLSPQIHLSSRHDAICHRRYSLAADSPHHLCCSSPSVIAVRRFTDHLGFTAESSRRGKLFVKLG